MKKAIETNNGLNGGLLKGKAHYDSNGNSLGGIKAIVTDQGGKPIEVEGNEVIINKKSVQSDKVLTLKGTPKEILSTLNQLDGNGVAIGDEEAEILAKYKAGGSISNKYHLGGDMSKHLAPNGKPSKLTHEQYHLVRKPEFKSWFGDWENDPENASKVVDKNGEPLVLFQGQAYSKYPEGNYIFDKDNQGIFFSSNKKIANTYGNVIQVFVNAKNLKDIRNHYGYDNKKISEDKRNVSKWTGKYKFSELIKYVNSDENVVDFYEGIIDKYGDKITINTRGEDIILKDKKSLKDFIVPTSTEGFKYVNHTYKSAIWNLVAKYVRDSNYEGIICTDEDNNGEDRADTFIVYNSNQVKLADGTNTTFDENNDDIRFAEGGGVNKGEFIIEELDEDSKQTYQILASKNIGGADFFFSRLNIYPLQNVFTIELPNGEEIGRATLNEKENYLTNIRVNDNYRRKGLALNLYNFIEYVIGKKLKPSPDKISTEAKGLWAKRNPNISFKTGGSISKMTSSELKTFYNSKEGKKLDAQTYSEWKRLVNMSKSELEKFYNSDEGKQAGLKQSQANKQGIDSGRESARWIMKMKDIPYTEWSSDMWRWAKKQISFIKRMSGMKGGLYNDKGEKTRKHTALLIWGHNPEQKFKGGGDVKGYDNFKNPILINGFISNKEIDGKEIFLITYNSGGQEGLDVHQTINPLAMLDAVEKKTGLHTNTLQVFIYEHTENSNRIETEDELEFLKNNYIVIIVDRDSVEFYNGDNPEQKFFEGGGIEDAVDVAYNKAVKDFENEGFDVRESSDSKTDFGHSRYFYVNYKDRSFDNLGSGLKVRVSDHSVTNQFRMSDELHIIPNMYSFTLKLAIIDAKIKLMHELFNREKGINLIPYEKEVRQSNLKDTDIIISERFGSGKRVPITEKVYMVKRFKEQPIIKYIDKKTGEIVKTFNDEIKFAGGGELEKGTEHEMEHLDTLKKVAKNIITPEQGVVETAKTHIKENPEYYEDLAQMEKENKEIDKLEAVKPFLGKGQYQVVKSYLDSYKEVIDDLYSTITTMPKTYETDGIPKLQKIAYLHYFSSSSDWYILEKDIEEKQLQAFGFTILNGDTEMAELGYIDIEELKQYVELDFYFEPKTLSEIIEPKTLSEIISEEVEEEKELIPEIKTDIKSYKNPYEINKAIERLVDRKNDTYSANELEFISYYSGYGGLEKFGEIGIERMKGLMYEFYTPDAVVKKMWALAYKYGYGTIGDNSVFEPSVGIGAFLKYAPKDVRLVANEINEYSAKICEILYPNAKVELKYFEQNFLKSNSSIKNKTENLDKYSLIIGNPPYGKLDSKYIGMGEGSYSKAGNFTEYFITRGLDLLVQGGLLIYIVGAEQYNGGSLFLDSELSKVKEIIFDKADLLDAYRLPINIFERTGVSSEIVVFKKR